MSQEYETSQVTLKRYQSILISLPIGSSQKSSSLPFNYLADILDNAH